LISAIEESIANYGLLVSNFNLCKNLASALSSGDHSFNTVPTLLQDVIEKGRWLDRIDPHTNHRITLKPREFRRFIEGPTPEGLATSDSMVRQYLKTPRLIDLYNRATVGEKGASEGDERNPDGVNQHDRINPNIIRVNPDGPDPRTSPIRDRTGEPRAGTSRGYALRRLARERPDLHALVLAEEISPHAAMVEAGFQDRLITVPDDPEKAARRLRRHFQGDRLAALITALQDSRHEDDFRGP
jgi:hypothetical protein